MNLIKTISTSYNSLQQRVVKFFRFGKDDVQTALQYGPYGYDANPVKDMIALYGKTAANGETVILGYLHKNLQAGVGETRIFATDADGAEKFYIWLRNTGIIEIGGTANYAVKFNELKTEFNKLKTDFNNHLTEYNTHTHVGVTVGIGATGTTVPSTNTNTSNIDNAKNDKIKTI